MATEVLQTRPRSAAVFKVLPSRRRDVRIDFFKGIALLIVLIDHIEGWAERSVIETWTLINLGFSDAAEIFIYLSGFVFAVAYSRTIDREGLWGCLKKALGRSLQIYVAYVLASLAVIGIGALFLEWDPPSYQALFPIGAHAWESIVAALMLSFHPWGFDILAMYVPVLPLMAVLLYLLRGKGPEKVAAWVISLSLYVAVQINPHLNLPRFGDGQPWYFNPLAWQFLFFLGLVVGDPGRKPIHLGPRWLWVTLSLAMVAWGFVVLKVFQVLLDSGYSTMQDLAPMINFYRQWGGKSELDPLRILHFLALAYLASLVFRPSLRLWSQPWVQPLLVAGRNSLEVYAVGLVLSFVGVFVMLQGLPATVANVILIDVAACAASLGMGYLVDGAPAQARRETSPQLQRAGESG